MYNYKIFGLSVGSRLCFNWPLEQIKSPPKVDCEILQSTFVINRPEGELIYTSSAISPATSQSIYQLFSSAKGLYLSYSDQGHFKIEPSRITYFFRKKIDGYLVEAILFRVAIVLWLELIGKSVLHASGVVIINSAIGFLANSNSGKSTLAAAFLRKGANLLTDDILPVDAQADGYQARPSYPLLRLLPQTARALGYKVGEDRDNLEKHPIRLNENYGQLSSEAMPLAALYLPERRNNIDKVSIEVLSSKQAYLGLVQHSFIGKWLIKSPLNAQRLDFFASLVKEIPIKRLVYPSGYEHLPAVVEAVSRDLGY